MNKFLSKRWVVDEDDCLIFNGFARTLMRVGIVDHMEMEAQFSRYALGVDEEETCDWSYYIHVVVGVMIGEVNELYDVYEGWK